MMGNLAMLYPRLLPPRPRKTSGRKKWGLLRAWASGHPLWLSWQVTYRCNMRCSFCNYWQQPSAPESELSVEQFRDASRNLAQLGCMLISLAGGEPLVRSDIPEVVEAVARYHMPFITTNGWNASADLARDIYRAGCWGVSISLDYADARRHDDQRGRAGCFDRAVQAIELFAQARRWPWQRTNVMCVLMHDNLAEIEKLLKLAHKLDAYLMVQPYSTLKTGQQEYAPPQGVSRELLRLRQRYPNFLSNPYFLSQFDRFLSEGQVPGCLAGRAFCNIDETGQVALCVEKRDAPLGHILTTDPGQLVRALHRAADENQCNRCWYNCRGEVEALYNFHGFMTSLPTLLHDRGRPSQQPAARRR